MIDTVMEDNIRRDSFTSYNQGGCHSVDDWIGIVINFYIFTQNALEYVRKNFKQTFLYKIRNILK
jgi:hypothetical protein